MRRMPYAKAIANATFEWLQRERRRAVSVPKPDGMPPLWIHGSGCNPCLTSWHHGVGVSVHGTLHNGDCQESFATIAHHVNESIQHCCHNESSGSALMLLFPRSCHVCSVSTQTQVRSMLASPVLPGEILIIVLKPPSWTPAPLQHRPWPSGIHTMATSNITIHNLCTAPPMRVCSRPLFPQVGLWTTAKYQQYYPGPAQSPFARGRGGDFYTVQYAPPCPTTGPP